MNVDPLPDMYRKVVDNITRATDGKMIARMPKHW